MGEPRACRPHFPGARPPRAGARPVAGRCPRGSRARAVPPPPREPARAGPETRGDGGQVAPPPGGPLRHPALGRAPPSAAACCCAGPAGTPGSLFSAPFCCRATLCRGLGRPEGSCKLQRTGEKKCAPRRGRRHARSGGAGRPLGGPPRDRATLAEAPPGAPVSLGPGRAREGEGGTCFGGCAALCRVPRRGAGSGCTFACRSPGHAAESQASFVGEQTPALPALPASSGPLPACRAPPSPGFPALDLPGWFSVSLFSCWATPRSLPGSLTQVRLCLTCEACHGLGLPSAPGCALLGFPTSCV